ncbi:DUF3097 domain-containing protein [Luteococcus peritonei]|uniref:DUF3097 domain-containing protein n=1 Tax=Luteococcus peritonei TaxID=88874 RepID=A0ABW4RTT0_9ACTN
MDRYSKDVLRPGWQRAGQQKTTDVPMELGMVVEEPSTGFVGAIVKWENGVVVLEDRKLKRRSFPVGPGFLLEGKPVKLCIPPRTGRAEQKYTASGSRASEKTTARVALPSRIYVEGRHDAELVEKVWGDDLRHVGVVVEYLGGIDDLVGIVAEFRPEKGRRLGVLVDHLVSGSKESRIAREVAKGGYGDYVMIGGHRFIDVWQAVRPERIGIKKWPEVPMDVDWKKGTLAALNLPHADQKDVAQAWQAILARVTSFRDLDPAFVTEIEKLIDFVTQDHDFG